ncbi:MAG: hypothetical protein Harvfovirus72_4 [Harvfovirus sp.]|uniref:Uncharacterized protein n=1 Tax=Harvfovirus sp. TaxID=2487768 RepID=A0A3G5A3V9_9VIRU|nr:MAG: hypothetical protein Harvfovirus72_4 [Harvfovirus sp.]
MGGVYRGGMEEEFVVMDELLKLRGVIVEDDCVGSEFPIDLGGDGGGGG